MRKIKNYRELVGKGDTKERKMVLDMLDEVLTRVDAGKRILDMLRYDGRYLVVGEKRWDLSEKKNVYLFGAGKACNSMAQAVCSVLGERLTKGIISVKIAEQEDHYTNTEVFIGGHPVPNAASIEAAKAILNMIEKASADDLFIAVISGGSSALLSYPVDGISLEDDVLTQDLLLKSGAKILEINAVRRHMSKTNGGRLMEAIQKVGAELITFIVGDSVGATSIKDREKPSEFFGTPIGPDSTTIEDARAMVLNYDLMSVLADSVIDFLWDDERIRETPKSKSPLSTSFVLDNVCSSCEAALEVAAQKNINIMVLSTALEGESREAGHFLSSVASEVIEHGRPINTPCYIVCSGETTTKIEQVPRGTGGPSQELVLGFCLGTGSRHGIALASVDTEGTDGTTKYAGGIVDSYTLERLKERDINIFNALRDHSSCEALERIHDNIYTGNTGTNICDFNVMYIS